MQRKVIEQKYRDMGLEYKHVSDEPGKVYKPHRHGQAYLYSLSGSIKLKLDDGDWQSIEPGREVIIKRHQLHEAVVGPDGWEYIFAWHPEEAKEYGL
jgi:quercetin dioxygenase-like cupin family protein